MTAQEKESTPGSASSEDAPTASPRIGLAVADEDLKQRLADSLGKAGVQFELITTRKSDLESLFHDRRVDLIVVSRSQVPDDIMTLLREQTDDDAGIAVLSEDDDPTDRARLRAAGASGVIDPSRASAGELTRRLEELAEIEQIGGQDGPEIRGNHAEARLTDFLAQSMRMREFVDQVSRVVEADASLLITGETGVGKERLARAIHAESPRRQGPFIAVNCGALPEALLESELFGHEKGSFTGASERRKGHFEQADGGTIFLDEIGEMPAHLQVKLLTVLQRHEVTRIGATGPVSIDVRVIAATNRDLKDDVTKGDFREDLFYRLNVISLQIPALRERPEDIPDLVGSFINYFRESLATTEVEEIGDEALAALMAYSWPGNVRELINVIERAMLLGRSKTIRLKDLPDAIAHPATAAATNASAPHASAGASGDPDADLGSEATPLTELSLKQVREQAVARAEKAYLEQLLRDERGKLSAVASRAGIGSRALYDRMRRYDLYKEDFKG